MNTIRITLSCLLIVACQHKPEPKKVKHEKLEEEVLKVEIPETSNQLDTLLNIKDYLVLGKKPAKIKVVKEDQIKDFPTFKKLVTYDDDVIMGENIDRENVEVYRKYNLKTSFEDYPVKVYKGKLAPPDFSSNPNAKRFITRIKEGCEDGINFAGHYTLISWGCGSPCQSGVVVNRKNGRIFDGVDSTFGSKFKKDSKMIVINVEAIDTAINLIGVYGYSPVSHEIWTGTQFKTIEK